MGTDDEVSIKSSISSKLGEAGGRIVESGFAVLQKQQNAAVQAILSNDAAGKTVLNGGYDGSPVVMSPHIQAMIRAYKLASRGRVIVMCSPADSGKTRAAEFLLHGAYSYRPTRSLMISAAGMSNFEREFSEKLGVSSVASLGEFILGALSTKASPSAASELAKKAGDLVDKFALCFIAEKHPFDQPIEIRGQQDAAAISGAGFHSMPVLVIDNFNEDTEENEVFVKKLLNEASQYGVVVFILTAKTTWATKLVSLNGGSKIKPLYGNVDNAEYQMSRAFAGTPRWNELPWPVETLRQLVREICQTHSIDPVAVVPDGAKMLPVEALDRVYELADAATRARQSL